MSEPRGIKNKNPGNLRYRAEWNWPGVVGVDNKQFAIFESPERGLQQFGLQLKRYRKRGLNTLAKIIPVYAPPGDSNNVPAYVASVERQTGIGRDDVLDLDDRKVMEALMRAFTRHEQGPPPTGLHDWYDDATYQRALDLLKPLTKSRTIGGAAGAAAATVAGAVVEVATNNVDAIAGSSALWPKYGALIAALVALCCIGVVVYARLEARRDGVR
jgi:hypothetical protein